MLRVEKIFRFLGDKIQIEINPCCWHIGEGSQGMNDPKKIIIELLCNENIMKPSYTLATVKHFYWKAPGEVVICYRMAGEK